MKKGNLKRLFALLMVFALVLGTGNATYASNDNAPKDSTGKYTVETLYENVSQADFDAKGTAPAGYEWQYSSSDKEVIGEEAVCGIEEHEHADTCYDKKLVCKTKEHEHTSKCYKQKKCNVSEHTHNDGCYGWKLYCNNWWHIHVWGHNNDCYSWELACNTPEHTHSTEAGGCKELTLKCKETAHTHNDDCYTKTLKCDKEHKHSEDCYKQTVKVYSMMMVGTSTGNVDEDKSTVTQGNGKITINVNVNYKTAGPVDGYKVEAKFHDNDIFAKYKDITVSAVTNNAGKVTMKISSTYDRVKSLTVYDKDGNVVYSVNKNDKIGIVVHPSTKNYTVTLEDPKAKEHNVKFVVGSKENVIVVKDGEKVEKPENPTKTISREEANYGRYDFAYWVDSCGNEFDFDTPITDDIVLQAKFVKAYFVNIYLVENGKTELLGTSDVCNNNAFRAFLSGNDNEITEDIDKVVIVKNDNLIPDDAEYLKLSKSSSEIRLEVGKRTVAARYYILKKGQSLPTGTKSDSSKKYNLVKAGSLLSDKAEVTADKAKVAAMLADKPSAEDENKAILGLGYTQAQIDKYGLNISWFRSIQESDGWHVDGHVVDANGNEFHETSTVVFMNDGVEVKKITATFVDNSIILTENGQVVNSIAAPEVSKASDAKKVYTFEGWKLNGELVDPSTLALSPETEYVLEAAYTVSDRYYTVTFVNGNDTNEVPVLAGDKVSKPADPTSLESDVYARFDFVAWTDENGNAFDFDTEIYSDVVLVASFDKTYIANVYLVEDGVATKLGASDLVYNDYLGRFLEGQDNVLTDNIYDTVELDNQELIPEATQAVKFEKTETELRLEIEYTLLDAKFYLLKKGETLPSGIKSDSSKKYVTVGKGKLYEGKAKATADADEVSAMIKVEPSVEQDTAAILSLGYTEAEIEDFGLKILWHRVIEESDGWHVDGHVVDRDGNEYNQVDHLVNVTWKNGDEILSSTKVIYGSVPEYEGEEPTKASDFYNTYSFEGFKLEGAEAVIEEYGPLTEDTVYYASFVAEEKETAKVIFKNEDEVVKTVLVSFEDNNDMYMVDGELVESIVAPTVTKAADKTYTYKFANWLRDEEVAVIDELGIMPGDEIVLEASFEKAYINYTVTFVDYDGKELAKYTDFHYGDVINSKSVPTATRAEDDKYTYAFASWLDSDNNIVAVDSKVEADIVLTASYTQTARPVVTPKEDEKKDDTTPAVDDKKDDTTPAVDEKKDDTTPAVDEKKDDTNPEVVDNGTDESGESDDADDSNDSKGKKKKKDSADDEADDATSENNNNGDGAATNDTPAEEATADDAENVANEGLVNEAQDAVDEPATEAVAEAEDTKEIIEPETPLGAQEDNCIIHWIILLLSILMAGYTITRVLVLKNSEETEEKKQEA